MLESGRFMFTVLPQSSISCKLYPLTNQIPLKKKSQSCNVNNIKLFWKREAVPLKLKSCCLRGFGLCVKWAMEDKKKEKKKKHLLEIYPLMLATKLQGLKYNENKGQRKYTTFICSINLYVKHNKIKAYTTLQGVHKMKE